MNRVWPVAIIFLGFLIPLRSVSQPIQSEITDVTVFQRGAQVTRVATVDLAAGRNEILFIGLTNSLNAETIQLGTGSDILILSLTHQINYLEEHPQQEKLQKLIAKRDSLNYQIEQEKATQQTLTYELDILMSNKNLKGSQESLTAVQLRQAMEFFRERLSAIELEKLEIKQKLAELEEELQKVNRQISELNNSRTNSVSEITAVIESERDQQVPLTLTYLVNSAGWSPSYDIRVDDLQQPAQLSYKANIRQSTGINWDGVNLTVSSAIPDRQGTLPKLSPWFLDFYNPQQAQMEDDMRQEQERAKAQNMPQLSEVVVTGYGQSMPVEFVQNQTSFSYKINVPYDVPSGGNPLTVEIVGHDLEAQYRYFASPKVRPEAYLTARVSDWEQYNLLPGQANLFFENTYVGKSTIDPQSVSDTLSFSLGKDESVVVERNKLREFQEKNFFGNRVRETFAWEISIRNTKNQAIDIVVEDQVPVPQNEDIEVSLNERSGAKYNNNTGKLTWDLNISAGETRNLRFEYEVEYPRGRQLRLE